MKQTYEGSIDISCASIPADDNVHSWTTDEYGQDDERMYTVHFKGIEAISTDRAIKKAILSDRRISDYMGGWDGEINTDKIMNVDIQETLESITEGGE
tara:strand:+ start:324 stop:617 length:294 start_codon:yes stop_codon:yes gene_type:complete